MSSFTPTPRSQVKRLPERAAYDRKTVFEILDEGFVCHVGFAVNGQCFVIPTAYGRVEETLYLHGSAASRMLRSLAQGIEVCVTVTLVDGLVLARSAFHHSMNYRSVMIFGTASPVRDTEEKLAALRALSEHIVPDRWDDVRPPNAREMKATLVLALHLSEVSAKLRTGPPVDDEEDYRLPVWAGEIPLALTASRPIDDPRLQPGVEPPSPIVHYSRPGRKAATGNPTHQSR